MDQKGILDIIVTQSTSEQTKIKYYLHPCPLMAPYRLLQSPLHCLHLQQIPTIKSSSHFMHFSPPCPPPPPL